MKLIHYVIAAMALIASNGMGGEAKAQDSDYIETLPAPSGTSETDITIYPNGTTIIMPGEDAGTVDGNHIDFNTPGIPDGAPDTLDPSTTTIIYDDTPDNDVSQ